MVSPRVSEWGWKALAVAFLASLLVAPPAWEVWKSHRPMTEARADRLIESARAQRLRLQNDATRDLLHCQETHAELGREIGLMCLELATSTNKDRMKEIRDLDRRIAELRAYAPR